MHILRSSYLHLYMRHVLRPFTSNPFPSAVPAIASTSPHSGTLSTAPTAQEPAAAEIVEHNATPIISTQRETAILDLFILIRSRQDMRSDESELYLDNEDDLYRDMFNYMQVRHWLLCISYFAIYIPLSLCGVLADPVRYVRNSRALG